MDGVTVSRLPIGFFVGIFVFYIATHIGIAYWNKYAKEQLAKEPENEDLKKQAKFANIIFKWYPFIFVILILIFVG